MQAQISTRRKNKNPQSGDYTCKCGKTYLSYAATYTHIKNKHQLEKTFLEEIGRPCREKLPKGRPKARSPKFISKEIQSLSVIEKSILKMYQLVNEHVSKMMLQGDKILSSDELEEADKRLRNSLGINNNQRLFGTYQDCQFIDEFNRHFTAEVAAKVKYVVLLIAEASRETNSQESDNSKHILAKIEIFDFWGNLKGVNQLIYDTYTKYKSLIDE